MKCVLAPLILLLFALLSYCKADVVSQNALDPDVPGVCLYNKEHYSPGEYQLPGCIRLVCSPRGWASIHSCVDYPTIKGCVRGNQLDINQPFPECCKRTYACRREDGSYNKMINF